MVAGLRLRVARGRGGANTGDVHGISLAYHMDCDPAEGDYLFPLGSVVQPGDDFRLIDWNLYGRMDKYFTKLFHVEMELALVRWLEANPLPEPQPPPE